MGNCQTAPKACWAVTPSKNSDFWDAGEAGGWGNATDLPRLRFGLR